jgi:hypothetical protein
MNRNIEKARRNDVHTVKAGSLLSVFHCDESIATANKEEQKNVKKINFAFVMID